MIKKYDLVMATGHNSAEDGLLLIQESRKQASPTSSSPTHAHTISMTIRRCSRPLHSAHTSSSSTTASSQSSSTSQTTQSHPRVGPEHCILSSDMGQPPTRSNPTACCYSSTASKKQGLTQSDIDQMSKVNPAGYLACNDRRVDSTVLSQQRLNQQLTTSNLQLFYEKISFIFSKSPGWSAYSPPSSFRSVAAATPSAPGSA